ncbi:MAG TPA: hypothetical protein VMY34_10950 [Acidimicrobiales bacterium]|nr:hypothetical protein [Acidimicrobiales bacterium]
MAEVRLVDLDVIKHYSLAIRQESADAAEVISVLEADIVTLRRLVSKGATAPPATRPSSSAKPSKAASKPTSKAAPKSTSKPAKTASKTASPARPKPPSPKPPPPRQPPPRQQAPKPQPATRMVTPSAKPKAAPVVIVPANKKVVQPTPDRTAAQKAAAKKVAPRR